MQKKSRFPGTHGKMDGRCDLLLLRCPEPMAQEGDVLLGFPNLMISRETGGHLSQAHHFGSLSRRKATTARETRPQGQLSP